MKENKKYEWVKTVIFMAFLCGFLVAGFLLPDKGFSQTENRFLEKKPKFSSGGLLDGSYGSAYETYLSDQFPGRDRWVATKTIFERWTGKKDVNQVYLGKENYYMEKFQRDAIDTAQMEENLNYLTQFAGEMAGKLGQDHVRLMLAPSASQVLKDKLPPFASPYDQSLVTGRLAGKAGGSLIVPVEEALAAHDSEEIFYRTDHHWTSLGAYYGYEAWAESTGREVIPLEAFQRERVSGSFLGTIQSKLNVRMMPDAIDLYRPLEPADYTVYYDGSPDGEKSLYNLEVLKSKDQYAVFLDGNHPWTRIVNESVQSEGKLLIIKDSFAHSLAPFLAGHFREVNMVDLRYFNMDIRTFMEQQGITDVLVLYQIPGFAKERTVYKLGNGLS